MLRLTALADVTGLSLDLRVSGVTPGYGGGVGVPAVIIIQALIGVSGVKDASVIRIF